MVLPACPAVFYAAGNRKNACVSILHLTVNQGSCNTLRRTEKGTALCVQDCNSWATDFLAITISILASSAHGLAEDNAKENA